MRSTYTLDPALPLNKRRIAHHAPAIPTSTSSSAPVKCAELTRSQSAYSEQNGDVNSEATVSLIPQRLTHVSAISSVSSVPRASQATMHSMQSRLRPYERASVHLERFHLGHPAAKIESAIRVSPYAEGANVQLVCVAIFSRSQGRAATQIDNQLWGDNEEAV
ncbi:hypothetical protein KIN20_004717 [Parelaphostrongylus tenuis]|uniref:Uncharacterized protein n=1 Tax=Parelaphostrongylus tenuis TaxID=148309 RepID=A0AAD5QJJ4_PARTN|nr:hypothetical protein KIN20_004717 [Parelaphostrongylus tenuis]